MRKRPSKVESLKAAMARAERERLVADMKEGRVLKAQTFKSAKGKGSYTRKTKHKEQF